MDIQLTKASLSDMTTIFDLAKKIWQHHYVPIIGQKQVDYMLETMYSSESLRRQMIDQGHIFYLIRLKDSVIGFISASGEQEVWIHKFYIDQDFQAKGYGNQVFSQIKDSVYPHANTFCLTVNRKNYKSINFYFKLGFKIDHTDDFDIGHGFWMNDFIMVLFTHKL